MNGRPQNWSTFVFELITVERARCVRDESYFRPNRMFEPISSKSLTQTHISIGNVDLEAYLLFTLTIFYYTQAAFAFRFSSFNFAWKFCVFFYSPSKERQRERTEVRQQQTIKRAKFGANEIRWLTWAENVSYFCAVGLLVAELFSSTSCTVRLMSSPAWLARALAFCWRSSQLLGSASLLAN